MQSPTLSQKKNLKTFALKCSETVLIKQKTERFSFQILKKIIKPDRLTIIKLLLVKLISFTSKYCNSLEEIFKFTTFNSTNEGNETLPEWLEGFIQKSLTAGVAVKKVKYNYLCANKLNKVVLVRSINQC